MPLFAVLFSLFNNYRKCCQSNAVSETATKALEVEMPVAPEAPLKDGADEAATEASVEDKAESDAVVVDADTEAQAAGYKCCGIF